MTLRAVSMAAPHARGSTQRGLARVVRGLGCPACAGIDPCRSPRRRSAQRLPRMRGDRPTSASRPRTASRAAPHARGSTPAGPRRERVRHGCPACAGIDPPPACSCQSRRGLPRMRGDRPRLASSGRAQVRAAPHARGSTHEHCVRRIVRQGCPACAGIDPQQSPRGSRTCRLPRMRGDRPCQRLRGHPDPWAAPHARGSTHMIRTAAQFAVGCPACAGIDPTRPQWSPSCPRLPRMRGDRPTTRPPHREPARAAPHARGSTHGRRVRLRP